MRTPFKTVAAALAAWVTASSSMALEVVNFDNDAGGSVPNGFVSSDSPYVSFSDTANEDLNIFNNPPDTIGNSLAVLADDESGLLMEFTLPITSLSISFGNDQASFTDPTDLGVLMVYDGATLLQTLTVPLNRNTSIDQTLSWISSGTSANRAEFYFGDASLNPIPLTELVDNITFTVEVPEPSTYAAIGFVSVAAALAWRRRKRA
jgi:hypothetical protein